MLLTLDFETYWDDEYTLKKLSTSEYVRDPRFKVISCSIKKGKNKPFCYFGHEKIKEAFENINWSDVTLLAHHCQFDGLILSHHFGKSPAKRACTLSMARALHGKSEKADLATVTALYGVTNKLAMPDFKGRTVEELSKQELKDVAVYNNADVMGCYEVYEKMCEKFPLAELDLIDITIKMFTDPVLEVNLPKAKKELKREQKYKFAAIEATGIEPDLKTLRKALREGATQRTVHHEGRKIILSSTPQFVEEMKKRNLPIPMKPSPTVKDKEIPALAKTDDELQTLLLHPDENIVKLVEGRLAAKSTISESRATRLIDYGSDGKKLPIYLNYYGAHTGRWSGGDKLNPQNFKQKAKEGGALRECIKAPAGSYMVVVDAAQIEARVVAWLAGCETILDAFRNKRDIYSEFATDAYGRLITKLDKEERFVGKTCILGLGFGMGAPKLQRSLISQSINQGLTPVRLADEICMGLVRKYRAKYREIPKLWDALNNYGIAAMLPQAITPYEYKCLKFHSGGCDLPNGLTLLYPELSANIVESQSKWSKSDSEQRVMDASYKSAYSRSKIYGGLLAENVVQALARIIVANAMREIAKRYRVVMMTHDENVYLVFGSKSDAKKAYEWGVEEMSKSPSWAPDLPLSAEGGFDIKYSK